MNLLRIIIIILAGSCLVYLIWWNIQNPQISLLSGFLVSQIPSLFAVIFLAMRSTFLSNKNVPLPVALKGNGMAVLGTVILPARLSELGKPLYFNMMSDFPMPRGMAVIVEERIWDMVALAVLIAFTMWMLEDATQSAALAIGMRSIFVLSVLGLLVIIFLPIVPKVAPFTAPLIHKYKILENWSLQRSLTALTLSLLAWGASLTIMICAYTYSGLPTLTFAQLLFLFVASTLGLVVSFTPGSIGTYEGALAGVLVSYGVDWESALAFAIGFRFCWLAIPFIVAMIAFYTLNDKGSGLLKPE